MGALFTILGSVAAGLLLAFIIYFVKSRFGTQPKLRVRLLSGLSSSGEGAPGNIKITWHKRLELYNLTGFPALEVSFLWPQSCRILPVRDPEPPHVNPTETRICEIDFTKEFPRDQIAACHNRFTELLPEELRSFVLIVQYRNDKGISFFTRYERNGEEECITYHRSSRHSRTKEIIRDLSLNVLSLTALILLAVAWLHAFRFLRHYTGYDPFAVKGLSLFKVTWVAGLFTIVYAISIFGFFRIIRIIPFYASATQPARMMGVVALVFRIMLSAACASLVANALWRFLVLCGVRELSLPWLALCAIVGLVAFFGATNIIVVFVERLFRKPLGEIEKI